MLRKKKGRAAKGSIKAVKGEYNGQKYLSGLEIYTAKKLEEHKLLNDYEGVTFLLMEGFTCPATCLEYAFEKDKVTKVRKKVFKEARPKVQKISYTPDFPNLKEGWVIECKGHANDAWANRLKLFKKYLYDHQLAIRFYMPSTTSQVDETIADILKHRNA